jgi:hypothetical protein
MPFVASARRANSLYAIAYSAIAHAGIAYNAVAHNPAPKASRFCRLPPIVYRLSSIARRFPCHSSRLHGELPRYIL